MEPTNDANVQFFCYLSRGFIQKNNRQVGMMCSMKYARIAEYPKFGEPDASNLTFIPNPDFKETTPSIFQVGVTQWYRVEYNLVLCQAWIAG